MIGKIRQLILTYVEIWNKDIQSGIDTNCLPFDFFSQINDMKSQLGPEEFIQRQKEESDWHTEMRKRVRERFVEALREIAINPHVPPLVQEKAKEIQNQLV